MQNILCNKNVRGERFFMIHRCIANKELFLRYVNNMPCDGESWRKTWQPNLEKSSARILMYNLSSMARWPIELPKVGLKSLIKE